MPTHCQLYVARHGVYFTPPDDDDDDGVYFSRLSLPTGQNVYFCCSRYGILFNDIAFITKDDARSYVRHA